MSEGYDEVECGIVPDSGDPGCDDVLRRMELTHCGLGMGIWLSIAYVQFAPAREHALLDHGRAFRRHTEEASILRGSFDQRTQKCHVWWMGRLRS